MACADAKEGNDNEQCRSVHGVPPIRAKYAPAKHRGASPFHLATSQTDDDGLTQMRRSGASPFRIDRSFFCGAGSLYVSA
jgi:hypothetical protein